MKERLIELLKQRSCVYVTCDRECGECHNVEMYDDAIESIADHLIANGVIVPPCEVGTKVYFAGLECGECLCGELVSYCLDAAHLWFNCHYDCGLNYWHPIEDFNTRVFLTKAEAEKALAERSGK